MSKPTISVALLAKSETVYFEKALQSAKFANEIVVLLDEPHSEETEKIAKKYATKVLTNPLKDFATQKNLLFKNASSDWIFLLDADEEISDSLQQEVEENISTDKANAFWIPTKNIIFGKWIRHTGWYPDKHIRLFKNGLAKYEGLVHEQLIVEGKIAELKNPIIHNNYQSVTQFIMKQNLYSDLEANRVFQDGRKFSLLYLFGKPLKEFITRYIFQKGYRDGRHGFLLSILMAMFRVMVAIKLWDLSRNENCN